MTETDVTDAERAPNDPLTLEELAERLKALEQWCWQLHRQLKALDPPGGRKEPPKTLADGAAEGEQPQMALGDPVGGRVKPPGTP